jgi:hypothetical protein
MRWMLTGLLLVAALAQSQGVYNYFPPPGITYTVAGGMALGSATGGACGAGCLNAQSLEINGTPVTTGAGSVTSVSVVTANGLSGSVANPTSTPAITLNPTFTGIAYANGSAFSVATSGEFPTLNQSTTGNAATATLASAASAFASTPSLCGSGQAAQGITASGNAVGCITPYSVINENAGTFFAGPCTGTAALPTFRIMCVSDLPLSSAITWTGNNTWTGNSTMTPASGAGLAINGAASADALDVTNGANGYTKVIGSTTTGESNGLEIVAGTNSSDTAFQVENRAGSATLLSILGNGTASFGYIVNLNGTTNFSSGGSATLAGTNTISGATTVSGSLTLTGTTTASPSQGPGGIGYMGVPPASGCSSGCTLAVGQRGETVWASSGTVTAPASVFVQGDTITVIAYGGNVSIAAGAGLTLYWANGTASSTGTRTLTNIGIATIVYESPTVALITGSGIS